MSTATLIVDCPECVDPSKANQAGRQADGLREWTAEFGRRASFTDTDVIAWRYRPVDGEDALRCPECGALGRVWSY